MDEANIPEDGLEHIAKEAAEGAHFEFNPAAWSAMESKLDALQPTPFSWWKVLFPIGGLALLLVVLLSPIGAGTAESSVPRATTQTEAPTKEAAGETSSPSEPQSTEKSTAQDSSAEPDNTAGNQEAVTSNDTEDTASQNQAASVRENAANEGAQSQANLIGKTTDNTATTASNSAQISQSNAALSDQSAEGELIQNETGVAEKTANTVQNVRFATTAEANAEEGNSALGGAEELVQQGEIAFILVPDYDASVSFEYPHFIFPEDTAEYQIDPSDTLPKRSRFAISALVSLDMSATGLEGFTDPGTMVGIGVEYYVSRGWSIQTGVGYSVKKYTARGDEYITPAWALNDPSVLTNVTANCKVIDIPVNVRKYFTTKKGRTFFASGGVSTYLMLREDYNYDYSRQTSWPDFWRYEDRNNHFFGIMNLSVGYEKPLGKSLALGIEPFMKLPLTGIGEGRVRFLSFGTNIAIKFRK